MVIHTKITTTKLPLLISLFFFPFAVTLTQPMLANGLKSNQYFVSKTAISAIFLLMLLQFLNHDTNLKPLIKRKIGKETLMYRTVLWTLRERERMALKHVKYHV